MRVALYTFITILSLSACGGNEKKSSATDAPDSLATHYLDLAVRTANWLESNAISTPSGLEWKANPKDTVGPDFALYHGSAGIVVFYLELFHTTGDSAYLKMACKASDRLLLLVSDELPKFRAAAGTEFTSLYSGLGGIGFTLEEMYSASGNQKYRDGMLKCIKVIKDSVKVKGSEASWSVTEDVLAGDAGTGLFLLYAYARTKDSTLKDLAAQVGNSLVRKALSAPGGLKWPMEPDFPRLMPNFAHGTSGICYFLMKLYEATGNKEFLPTASRGATYLKQLAEKNNGLVFHHESDGIHHDKCKGPACIRVDSCIGNTVFYLSWCHGPAGTGRLFYLLLQETKDSAWSSLMSQAANTIMTCGVPEKLTDGFWNNLGQCCGSAGMGEHFVKMYNLTHKKEYLDFAHHLAGFIEKGSEVEGNGIKFPLAENNRERDVVYAQTGYMEGAAGIGAYFIHLYEFEKGMKPAVRFPDDPF